MGVNASVVGGGRLGCTSLIAINRVGRLLGFRGRQGQELVVVVFFFLGFLVGLPMLGSKEYCLCGSSKGWSIFH